MPSEPAVWMEISRYSGGETGLLIPSTIDDLSHHIGNGVMTMLVRLALDISFARVQRLSPDGNLVNQVAVVPGGCRLNPRRAKSWQMARKRLTCRPEGAVIRGGALERVRAELHDDTGSPTSVLISVAEKPRCLA